MQMCREKGVVVTILAHRPDDTSDEFEIGICVSENQQILIKARNIAENKMVMEVALSSEDSKKLELGLAEAFHQIHDRHM